MSTRRMLVWGGYGSCLVAALHLALGAWMLFVPGQALALSQFFGGPRIETWGIGPIAASALALCLVFLGFAWYAFSASGRGRALILSRQVALSVGLLYTLRGLLVLPELAMLVVGPAVVPPQRFGFSLVSLTIGLLHLAGPALAVSKGSPEWYTD